MKKTNTKNKKIYNFNNVVTEYQTDYFLTEAELHQRIFVALTVVEQINDSIRSMKKMLKEIEFEKCAEPTTEKAE